MKEVIENAIQVLVQKIDEDKSAEEALKYTQSALNLAHTLRVGGYVEEAQNSEG